MLDPRARTLLKTLIERYIADGQPVGSRTLSRYSGLDLSPATVRNVMADLEELGYIASPHTSAGRVPTPKGYRFFVDSLLVMTPRRSSSFKQVEFLRLADKRVLLIIVTPEGDVQNRILLTERDYSPTQLIEASNYLNAHFAGLDFESIRSGLHDELSTLRDDITSLMTAAVEASNRALTEDSQPVVISGQRNLLGVADLSDSMERLRQLFDLFEQRTRLLELLDSSSRAQGVQIFIGGESQLVPMEELSVVVAPYSADGRIVGTLGVIGPTRMAYERVIPIVDITAKLVSSALSHNV